MGKRTSNCRQTTWAKEHPIAGRPLFQAKSGKVNRSAHNGKMAKMIKNLTSGLKDEPRVFLPSPFKTVMVGQNLWSLNISPPLL